MSKVKLTKEQAKALEELKKIQDNNVKNYSILVNEKLGVNGLKKNNGGGWVSPKFSAANSISNNDFLIALYQDYEIELTEDEALVEKVKKYFKENIKGEQYQDSWDRGYDEGWKDAANYVLKELNKPKVQF